MFEGLAIGMVVGAVGLGFRHGIDWDHLAALADLTGYDTSRRRRILLATSYALGHAAVVLVLGLAAILLGASLPEGVDEVMERVVGATLVVLGAWVLVSLVRQGRDFRLRSRWMLVSSGIARGVARLRRGQVVVVEHDHPHDHAAGHGHGHVHEHPHEHPHEHSQVEGAGVEARPAPSAVRTRAAHSHRHRHVGVLRDPFAEPSLPVAVGIGCVHGIGAETPTQLVILTTAAGAQGQGAGVAFLLAFVIGLIASNTTVASAMAVGRLDPERSFAVYATLSVVIAVFSIVAGTAFLLGAGTSLPVISGS